MLNVAIKILALIAGIVAGVASYPYLNEYVFALVAFVGAVAVGIIAGAFVSYLLSWLFANVNERV